MIYLGIGIGVILTLTVWWLAFKVTSEVLPNKVFVFSILKELIGKTMDETGVEDWEKFQKLAKLYTEAQRIEEDLFEWVIFTEKQLNSLFKEFTSLLK